MADFSLADNGFGAGLPPQPDNGPSWPLMQTPMQPLMQPLLTDAASIKPDFAGLVCLVNVDTQPHTLRIDALRGRAYELHPVHRSAVAADRRAATGSFTVPPRTAVVFVLPASEIR